jgi:hypothetical protein
MITSLMDQFKKMTMDDTMQEDDFNVVGKTIVP